VTAHVQPSPYDDARAAPEAAKRDARGRTPYQRDRARVLHSAALRRLAGKTQVVEPGDAEGVPRTRLTHSLECAQIGRELGAALGCDPDVVDAAGLAHDLGHPPFGHNGEVALDAVGQQCGGFEGNAQSLRVLTRLEAKVVTPDGRSAGLNLTRSVLDAATKYPWPRQPGSTKYGVYADDAPVFAWLREGAPAGRRCLEAQVMDWADDVAYSVHDLEDGVVGGLVPLAGLRGPGERAGLFATTRRLYVHADDAELADALDGLLRLDCWPTSYDGTQRTAAAVKATTSALIGRFCGAAERATREAHGRGPLRRYDADLVVPRRTRVECALLKGVTAHWVMSRAGAAAVQQRQREALTELVTALLRRPDALDPAARQAWDAAGDDAARLRAVLDAVAGLTDAGAWRRHERLVRGDAG
jgi:dGTPase